MREAHVMSWTLSYTKLLFVLDINTDVYIQ